MADHSSPGRTRATALLALFVAFLAGLGSGFTVDWLDIDEMVMGERSERRERGRAGVLEGLDLTAEQRRQIDEILAERERQTEAFWDTAGPRLRQIVDSARAEIRAVLTPAQREAFDRRIAERKAYYKKKRRGRDRDAAENGT